MKNLRIIVPVKDAVESAIQTLDALKPATEELFCEVTVYNDFSKPENTTLLQEACKRLDFNLVNISELTDHPSPNYLLVLQREQKICREQGNTGLIIVESDVIVRPDTLVCLKAEAGARPDSGIVAAVTVDEEGRINYPYLYAKRKKGRNLDTRRHLSFCCSLLTPLLLEKVDFQNLNSEKDWFDVTISHMSLEAGLHNWLLCTLPVIHKPHQSRPWKQLKYQNPLKYYWRKLTKGFDKI